MAESAPGTTPPVRAPEDRLDSWKEIAAYLNRDLTTVQRWEKREGMPVHRHLHDKMGSVHASRAELDAWVRSRNLPEVQENGSDTPALNPGAVPQRSAISTSTINRAIPWALFGATAVAFAVLGWVHKEDVDRNVLAEPVRLQIPMPVKPPLRLTGLFALSPNGRQLAWVATSTDGVPRIWIRALDSLEIRPLSGTESVGTLLFWSPDSRFIAFDAGGKLRKIDSSGGPVETVCVLTGMPVGGSWSKNGAIIFGQYPGTLMRVSATGGVATPLTALDLSHGEVAHAVPWFLPDGRHFAYLRDSGPNSSAISIGSLDAKPKEQDSTRLVETASGAAFVPSSHPDAGQMLFLRGTTLMAQPFDPRRLKLSGNPVRVVQEPIGVFLDYSQFTVSTNGTLAYWSSGDVDSQLMLFDAQGKVVSRVVEPGPYVALALSPDGTRAFLSERSLPDWNVALWLLDLSRGTNTLFELSSSSNDIDAVWAPDGRRIIFASDRTTGQMDLYEKAVSGAADAEALIKSNDWKVPSSWSPDGHFLLYTTAGGKTKNDLWVLPLGNHQEPVPFLRTEFNEEDGRFSPDGHWVAYVSDESGRNEVYVRPFLPDALAKAASGTGDKFLLSSNGGVSAMWRQDGKELYYLDPDRKLTAVKVTMGRAFQADKPRLLFQAPPESANEFGLTDWAPSPDGKSFLFLAVETQGTAPFTVVLNWQAALKKMTPDQ